ncbi:MAG: hypothetical protein JXA97_11200 [Anaerolineales bacterium]|nr:hypothetical protein [Anaerolineales bacterium]
MSFAFALQDHPRVEDLKDTAAVQGSACAFMKAGLFETEFKSAERLRAF